MKIKTFTLMTLALLVSVMSFAQKSKVTMQDGASFKAVTKEISQKVSMVSSEGISAFTQKTTTSKPSTSGIALRRAEVVTLPAGVDVSYYTLSGTHNRANGKLEKTIKVAYDGDDVYVSGLSYFCPDAFVKGTFTNDNTVVFSAWQYFGSYSFSDGDADLYFAGIDSPKSGTPAECVATYDAANDVFTFTNCPAEFYSMGEDTGLTAYWSTGTTITKIEGEVELPVEIPSDLETEVYSYSAQDYFDEKEVSWNVKVGFYNEEVYIQGLSSVLPNAWVKGTLADGVVTIPNQLLGSYRNDNLYFVGYNEKLQDSYFLNYDAQTGSFVEGDNAYMVNLYKDKIDRSVYEFLYDVKIKKIVERVATPANPSFANMQFTSNGDKIETVLSVVDTEGNGLVTSKLFYKLYIKDELGSDAALTFTKELYPTLENDMEEIPYGFDNADFANGVVALKMEHADWDKIGLQSIYKGLGEPRESEIVWYNIVKPVKTTLPEGLAVTVHDFSGVERDDQEDVEFSTTLNIAVDGNDLYIQGLAAAAGIEDSWVKGTKGDDGIYTFANGQELGSYSSYRLFLVGYNDTEGKVEEPKLAVDEEAGVYKFVNCFLNNANYTDRSYSFSHFHANSTIAIKGETDDPIVAPEGLVVEEYMYTGTDYFAKKDEDPIVRKTVKIGFAGNDVYLQGIASPYMPQAWIKGKKVGNKITFRTGKKLGDYNATTTLWFRSFAPDMKKFEDAVFAYDEESGVLTTDNNLSIATTKAAGGNLIINSDVVISKIEDKATTPSAPTFGNLAYTPKGNYIEFTIPTIDINGEGMLSDKLFYKFYSKDASGNVSPIIFTKEAYEKLAADMEEIPYGFTDEYDLYDDVVYLNMDISKWSQLGLQTIYKGGNETNTSEEIVWYNIVYPYSTGTLPEGLTAKAAEFKGTKTATSGVSEFTRTVNIAQKDNLLYIQGIANEDEGTNAAESLMIGVKSDNDTYTFPRGALLGVTESYLFFLAGYDDATKKLEDVKMQLDKENKVLKLVNNLIVNARYTDRLFYSSWYNAGSTIDASSIIDETGISVVKNEAADAATSVFNLAGQRVSRDYKGLVIKNGKKTFNK